MDFQGFLNDLQDWELSQRDKTQKMKSQLHQMEKLGSSSRNAGSVGVEKVSRGETRSFDHGQYSFARNNNPFSHVSSSFIEEDVPDASSEKEMGNEYFKQKKFKEAIDCYSRSIALSPTAVAFANRAMAYIKLRRFQEAEDDCTEALNLDDRYIKAYSRRATARKELGKLKESIEDSEFALRLEPNNQEIKKQYADTKALYEKAIFQKASGALRSSVEGTQKVGKLQKKVDDNNIHPVLNVTEKLKPAEVPEQTKGNEQRIPAKASLSVEEVDSKNARARGRVIEGHEDNGFKEDASASNSVESVERYHRIGKPEMKASVQQLASRATSRAMAEAAKNITPPTSAYQFEVLWRGFSGDCALQARLLKAISPDELPQIFKNALSATVLIDIIKCVASFFAEDMGLAVSYIEHLTKVSRFDMLIMCLLPTDTDDLRKIWDEVFCSEATPMEYAEILDNLRSSKYCLRQ